MLSDRECHTLNDLRGKIDSVENGVPVVDRNADWAKGFDLDGRARGRHEHVYRSLPRATAARRVRDMNEATDHALFPFSAEWLFLQKF
jgi:hypothetical protein